MIQNNRKRRKKKREKREKREKRIDTIYNNDNWLFIIIVNAEDFNVKEYKIVKTYKCPRDEDENGYKAIEKLDFTEAVSPFYPILIGLAVVASVILLFVR